jgi:hypothetical protein
MTNDVQSKKSSLKGLKSLSMAVTLIAAAVLTITAGPLALSQNAFAANGVTIYFKNAQFHALTGGTQEHQVKVTVDYVTNDNAIKGTTINSVMKVYLYDSEGKLQTTPSKTTSNPTGFTAESTGEYTHKTNVDSTAEKVQVKVVFTKADKHTVISNEVVQDIEFGKTVAGSGIPLTQASSNNRSYWDGYDSKANLENMIARAKAIQDSLSTEKNGTIITADFPDKDLSGVKLAPTGQVITYDSFNDLSTKQGAMVVEAMTAIEFAGIDWNKLTDEQKSYLVLMITYGTDTETATNNAKDIPNTNLSGVPLGDNGIKVQYNSMYDIVNGNALSVANAMAEIEAAGINWNDLSNEQKCYLILTHIYGEPQQGTLS